MCKYMTTCRSELAGAMCPAGKWGLSLGGQLRGFLQSLLSSEGEGNLSLQLVHPRSGWVCDAVEGQGLNVAEKLMPLEPRSLHLRGAGPGAGTASQRSSRSSLRLKLSQESGKDRCQAGICEPSKWQMILAPVCPYPQRVWAPEEMPVRLGQVSVQKRVPWSPR